MATRERPRLRELPILRENPRPQPPPPARAATSAHRRPRDAYRDVPILQPPTWHHLIAGYFYCGGISSGAYVIGTLAALTGGERLRTLSRTAHYVSFATLLPCPLLLILDLGKPSLFYHMLRIFKPSSPMSLGSWAISLHGAFSTLAAGIGVARVVDIPVFGPMLRLMPEEVVGVAGLPSGLTLGGYTGVLIGTTSIPVWYTSPLLGALFMSSALNTGLAAVTLAGTLTGRSGEVEHQATAPLSTLLGAVEGALLAGYLATSGEAAAPLFRGREGAQIAGVAGLTVAGLALEAASMRAECHHPVLRALAATATQAGGALLRWGIVFAGSRSAADRDGTLKAMAPSRRRPDWGAWRHG